MTKEDIIALLKRKESQYIEASKENHSNNTEVISNYNSGVAKGLRLAIDIVGMLDKPNSTRINFNFKKFSEIVEEKLKEDFPYIICEDLLRLSRVAYIHFKRDINIPLCDEKDYLAQLFPNISYEDISTIVETIYDYTIENYERQ